VLRLRLPDGVAWFKTCAPVQAFQPRLTTELFVRWPDRVTEVLGHEDERRWLLLGDAGTPIRVGTFAQRFAWARHLDDLPAEARPRFDRGFAVVLRRAFDQTLQ
jgi:hypothetical protein